LIASAHPYAGAVIGLATMHDKGRAVAPPFRRLLGARVLEVTGLDTDQLGTFSGDIARPASPVEVTDLKARMTFEAMDVDCAIASEGSYAPIDRVPLNAAGVEIMTFVDRKRGVVVTETLTTQRTNWRMQRFAAGDPRVEDAATALGLPRCGAIVMRNDDWSHPVKNLSTAAEVRAAIESEAPQSRDGLAVLIPDMRAHRNPWRMMAIRALAWRLARRLAHLFLRRAGLGPRALAARPALRVLRRAHRLDRGACRWLFRLRPRRGAAPARRPSNGLEAELPNLPGSALRLSGVRCAGPARPAAHRPGS